MKMVQRSSFGWWALRVASGLVVWVGLSACGGGSDSAPTDAQEQAPPIVNVKGPGEFKEATLLKTVSVADLTTAIAQAGGSALQVSPRYAVQAHRMTYLTVDGQGHEILASALVAVPQKLASAPSPVMSYQHGTIKTDAKAPSYLADPLAPELLFASLGYIVLSADYVGYGASKGAAHPYLLAEPSAAAVVDLLTAAKYWRQTEQRVDNGQLFLTGYSEGGYVTLAAQRSLQTGASPHRKTLVAVTAGAGPYNVGQTLDEVLKKVKQQYPLIGNLLNPGFLRFLRDEDRDAVRDAVLERLLGDGADVVFMPDFIDNYFSDNRLAIEAQSNVDAWRPEVPLYLFHGRDDATVPYLNASSTLQTMQAGGAGAMVGLTDCAAQPADHLPCVLPYWQFTLATFARVAKDL